MHQNQRRDILRIRGWAGGNAIQRHSPRLRIKLAANGSEKGHWRLPCTNDHAYTATPAGQRDEK